MRTSHTYTSHAWLVFLCKDRFRLVSDREWRVGECQPVWEPHSIKGRWLSSPPIYSNRTQGIGVGVVGRSYCKGDASASPGCVPVSWLVNSEHPLVCFISCRLLPSGPFFLGRSDIENVRCSSCIPRHYLQLANPHKASGVS